MFKRNKSQIQLTVLQLVPREPKLGLHGDAGLCGSLTVSLVMVMVVGELQLSSTVLVLLLSPLKS